MATKVPELELADSKKVSYSKDLEREIAALYMRAAKNLARRIGKIPKNANPLERSKLVILTKYKKTLEDEADRINIEIGDKTRGKMREAAAAVVAGNIDFMKRCGLDLTGGFSDIPDDVVRNLVNGNIYGGDWQFSKAIWKNGKKVRKDIDTIIAEGIAQKKGIYDIAKDLEKYVDPSAAKEWEWSKVYPGTNKKIDYNAQRLARTMVQHAYQLAFRKTVAKNPFVEGIIWHSAFAPGRTCQLCKDRDGQAYPKGKEPLDHPNGLCWLEAFIPKDMDQIADELIDWAHGKPNRGIDEYVKSAYPNSLKDAMAAKRRSPMKDKA